MEAIVARYSTIGEAECAKSALDAASIDVAVIDGMMIAINWMYSNAAGGVKLMVRSTDLERAFEILFTPVVEAGPDDEVTEQSASVDVEEEETPACPSCGNVEITRFPRLKIFAALSLIGYGVGAASGQTGMSLVFVMALGLILGFVPSHRCPNCGEKFNVREPLESEPEAPPPLASDLIEPTCPRCGSVEFYRIYNHPLKATPLLVSVTIPLILLLWLFFPKRQCDNCGLKKLY